MRWLDALRSALTPIALRCVQACERFRRTTSILEPIGSEDRAALADVQRTVTGIRRATLTAQSESEAVMLALIAHRTRHLPGAVAEVGAFRGGSASIIAAHRGSRPFYVFDRLAGLPAPTNPDRGFCEGQFQSTEHHLQNALSPYHGVILRLGDFPQTAQDIAHEFSFVHVDVDLYRPTLDALDFFIPRLTQGGIIVIHDYTRSSGVRAAIAASRNRYDVHVEPLTGSQVAVMGPEAIGSGPFAWKLNGQSPD